MRDGQAEPQTGRQLRNDADRKVGRSAGKKTGEGNSQQVGQPEQTHRDMDEYAI